MVNVAASSNHALGRERKREWRIWYLWDRWKTKWAADRPGKGTLQENGGERLQKRETQRVVSLFVSDSYVGKWEISLARKHTGMHAMQKPTPPRPRHSKPGHTRSSFFRYKEHGCRQRAPAPSPRPSEWVQGLEGKKGQQVWEHKVAENLCIPQSNSRAVVWK